MGNLSAAKLVANTMVCSGFLEIILAKCCSYTQDSNTSNKTEICIKFLVLGDYFIDLYEGKCLKYATYFTLLVSFT